MTGNHSWIFQPERVPKPHCPNVVLSSCWIFVLVEWVRGYGFAVQRHTENLAQQRFKLLTLLDLAAVGIDGGPQAAAACRPIRQSHPDVELISGGGVRGLADLKAFEEAGCDAVLVASALHDGRLSPKDVAG